MPEDHLKDDEIIVVRLPTREYKIMRELIEERQAMRGLKLWFSSRVLWLAAGVITIAGAFEALRQLGSSIK